MRNGDERPKLLGFDHSVWAGAVIVAVSIAFVATLVSSSGSRTSLGSLGGDFPSFYAAGSIVNDGDIADLYDIHRQTEAQEDLLGGRCCVLYFAYPPPVAAAYAPLARLPYGVAYALHTALMAAAAVGAIILVRPLVRGASPTLLVSVAVATTFYPLLASISLGQNSALVLFLVALSWRAAAARRDASAGVALGLLLFKPQYAIPLLGLHLVGRRIATTLAGVASCIVWWAAGAVMVGPGWVGDWLNQARQFNALDADVNGENAVSWLGLAEHAFGVGSPLALGIGLSLAAITAAILIGVWWGRPGDRLAVPTAAAAAGILLISPHAMFYDAALLVLVVAGVAASRGRRLPRLVLILWILSALHPLASLVGFTPVAIAVVTGFVAALVWRRLDPIAEPQTTTSSPAPEAPALSVVIPAFNEAGRLEPTLRLLAEWLSAQPASEVIVVDDGSDDGTSELAIAESQRFGHLRVIRFEANHGKGHAVRMGMLAASGDRKVFIDADGSTEPKELDRLLARDEPVVIGSVAVAGAAVGQAQGPTRTALGRVGNRLIQWLVLPGIEDSQRGAKAFRGDVADQVFRRCEIDGWGFDVEALAIGRSLGFEPVEVGIRWEDRPVGHVRPWHYLTTLVEVLKVRRRVGYQPPIETSATAGTP